MVFVLVVIFKLVSSKKFLVAKHEANNCMIFGEKGHGKDLLTQCVIKHINRDYFSNNFYGEAGKNKKMKGHFHKIALADLTVAPNTFNNLIRDNIFVINKKINLEGHHVYISDCGIYLPSTEDNQLNRLYPSLPILYATVRHLYGCNIHLNTQNLGRVWLKLREQADSYFYVSWTLRLFGLFLTKYTYYSRYESAEKRISPMSRVGLINQYNRALIVEYEALHGQVRNGFVLQRKKHLYYDTRHFHKMFFGETFNEWRERTKRSKQPFFKKLKKRWLPLQ